MTLSDEQKEDDFKGFESETRKVWKIGIPAMIG
jgi:Na+-driven multidrug efflux pump